MNWNIELGNNYVLSYVMDNVQTILNVLAQKIYLLPVAI